MSPLRQFALLSLALTTSVAAQDMIGVSWSGQIYAFDSFTGAINLLGAGLPGQNASARDDHGMMWSTATGSTLSVLDPLQPNASVVLPSLTADLRGLANGGGQFLWGIENGAVDMLVRIDKLSGAKTTVGQTGFTAIEALESFNYALYAWDTSQGLLLVNTQSGTATDINPAIGGAGIQIQWLCTRSDGKLIGGNTAIYEINPTTGATTFVASLSGVDLRGANAWQSFTRPFGTSCNGAFGSAQLTATVTGTFPKLVTVRSNNHAANAAGATIFGLSITNSGFGALPLQMDPFLGTSGCTLYVSMHANALGLTTTGPNAMLDVQFSFPLVNDLFVFYVQHVVLEPVAGGLSFSNAAIVQLGG
jgi:hypothetical protein